VVTLGGTAANLAQKELTGIYAGEIDRVKSVINDIRVIYTPAISESIDDASITSQVKYALFVHKSTSALQTKVTTNDGVVHITGEAASARGKIPRHEACPRCPRHQVGEQRHDDQGLSHPVALRQGPAAAAAGPCWRHTAPDCNLP
jgi:hypothetical protein